MENISKIIISNKRGEGTNLTFSKEISKSVDTDDSIILQLSRNSSIDWLIYSSYYLTKWKLCLSGYWI